MRRAGGAASRAMLLHRRTFTGTAHGMRYRGSPGVLGVGDVVVRKSSAARAAHPELRSLLVCCDWPGGRSYSRQAEEALPGRPIAPEGRGCP